MNAARRSRSPGRERKQADLTTRSGGVLLHLTSLSSRHGCGDAGPAARAFVDELAAARVRWWQMLPTQPIGGGPGFSPYSSPSAFAISPLVIAPEDLLEQGLLNRRDLTAPRALSHGPVNYPATIAHRRKLVNLAVANFIGSAGMKSAAFAAFRRNQAAWLEEWALFAAIREPRGYRSWTDWEAPLRDRQPKAIASIRKQLATAINNELVIQFLADRQFSSLHEYASQRGVGLVGDVPIFVSHDSADVWARGDLFKLRPDGQPSVVTGVPPDLFSRLGQKWGHPHYRWANHRRDGFAWWTDRFARMYQAFDVVRIDHFLGFHRAWEIPGNAKDARKGKWVLTPGREIFTAMRNRLGPRPIIAEDLGLATAGATALREHFGFPGMRVLQFGFSGGSEHLPWTYVPNCVAYTGTHDNETSAQWFGRITAGRNLERKTATILGFNAMSGDAAAAWQMVATVANSVANTTIFPLQDLMGLGAKDRMNIPGTIENNWKWRLQLPINRKVISRFAELLRVTGRQAPLAT